MGLRIRKNIGILLRTAIKPVAKDRNLEDALDICRLRFSRSESSSLGYWDDRDDSPSSITAMNLEALDNLRPFSSTAYLSLKAPALHYNEQLVSELAAKGRSHGVRLHFDSHGPETADATFSLIDKVRSIQPNMGCTLPGRWSRSIGDAEWAIQRGLSIRVVKGQWPCVERPTLDACEGFLDVIDRLAGRARRVSVATHDEALASVALERLNRAGTACELEIMIGMPKGKLDKIARQNNVPLRTYIPFGHGWLQYVIEQIRSNPSRALSIAARVAVRG